MHDANLRRIAVVLPDLRPGGAERMHLSMAREWLRRGFQVDLVLMRRHGELLETVPEGAFLVDLGVHQFRRVAGPMRAYVRQRRPSVILAAMWPLTVSATVAARLSGPAPRIVVSDHSMLSESYRDRGTLHRVLLRASLASIYRFCDVRVAVSKGVAADLAALSGLPKERFQVIYNPAAGASAMTEDGECPAELADLTGPLILTVGTLKAVKDHQLLIEAFSCLPAGSTATLCILGDGDLRPQLESQIARLGLQGRVLLPGFRADTIAWYRRADLFVLSSRHEGFGNVIVEAMEQGVPVVCTDCPSGPREILCDGQFGRLVPVGDAEALAEAMQMALHEEPDREALKTRARDFSVDKVAEEYLDVLLPGWREENGEKREKSGE